MNLRSIACSLSLLAFAAGCGGGTGGSFLSSSDELEGEALKISYFRAYPESRTKKPVPTFRVVMSETWKDRIGVDPRNPLLRAAPGKIFRGFMFDGTMRRILDQLNDLGVDKLKPRDPREWKFREMNMLAKNPQQTSFTRVFTFGSDTSAKSYYYRDQQFSKESIEIFVKCESFVSRVVDSNSIHVATRARPLFRR